MAQNPSPPRRRPPKDKAGGDDELKTPRKTRRVYAYVSDKPPSKFKGLELHPLRGSRLFKGLKLALVSERLIPAGLTFGEVFLGTREAQVWERPANVVDLREAPVKPETYAPDARARALLRGVKRVERDLESSGGAYSLEQVQELMHGITRQAVNNRVRDGSLVAVAGPSNRSVYPVVQFTTDGAPVAGLKAVRAALQTRSGWMLLNFLVNPDPKLGDKKPIDLLKKGKVDEVVEAAQRVGVQGA